MKAFQSYIFELNKPYEFRIKLATIEPTGEVMDKIKNALETYQLESVSPVKSLPIQEHREFPTWGPCESWQFDIKVSYPTNATGIRQMLKERAHLNPDWICVRNLNEAIDTTEAEERGQGRTGDLLTDPVLQDDPEGQSYAGQARVGNLLKELESRKFEFAQDSKEAGKDTNSVATGDTSPMSKQNKMYNPLKGKK
jgi:hypothetical protein